MTEASRGSGELPQGRRFDDRGGQIWPVCSGKSFNVWKPDTGNYYDSADAECITEHLYRKRLRQSRTASSAFHELDPAVIEDPATLPCRHPRIVFRDVTNSTNTRTMVTALIPGERVTTESAPYLLQLAGEKRDVAYVLGVLASMVFDWQSRRTVELHVKFAQLNAFSIPDPGPGDPIRDRVTEIAGRIAAADERFAEWAEEVGVPVGSIRDSGEFENLLAELDACVAHLYGLDAADLRTIYETFSGSVDYSGRSRSAAMHLLRIQGANRA